MAARISAAGVGATADLDTGSGRLSLAADDPANLVLDDGGSGLLEALGISAGSHRPTSSRSHTGHGLEPRRHHRRGLRRRGRGRQRHLRQGRPRGEPASFMVRTRGDLQKAVETAWAADTTHLAKDIGFGLDFENESSDVLSFTDRTEQRLVRALRGRPSVSEVCSSARTAKPRMVWSASSNCGWTQSTSGWRRCLPAAA